MMSNATRLEFEGIQRLGLGLRVRRGESCRNSMQKIPQELASAQHDYFQAVGTSTAREREADPNKAQSIFRVRMCEFGTDFFF